jgi:hypothetical protein
MGWTAQQRRLAIAILVIVVIVVIGVLGYRSWKKKHPDGFGDLDGWPTATTFGNLADTNPYGNYADGLQTFYPTFDEDNAYWTRA